MATVHACTGGWSTASTTQTVTVNNANANYCVGPRGQTYPDGRARRGIYMKQDATTWRWHSDEILGSGTEPTTWTA